MIASALVLLSAIVQGNAHPAGPPGPLSPRTYQTERTTANQAHDAAVALIDNRQELIANEFNRYIQHITQQRDAERTRIAERLADLHAQNPREVAAILAQRNEAHGRLRDAAGLYVALPDADPAVAVPVPAGVLAPGVVDALAQRNTEHARLEAERFANEGAAEDRLLRAANAEFKALEEAHKRECRQRLEQIRRDRDERTEAYERALAALATRSLRYAEQQGRAAADAAHAVRDGPHVDRDAARQRAADLLAGLQC